MCNFIKFAQVICLWNGKLIISKYRGMPKTYKNPPLIEAVCEFRFGVKTPLPQKQIDAFYAEIKKLFPLSKKGKIHSLEFKVEPNKVTGKDNKSYKEGFYEFDQYFSDDEKYSVQLDNGRVSIHRIKPYVSWTEFFPLIKSVYSAYIKNFSPEKLLRIGVRYVNEIAVPTDGFAFGDYFNIKASLPSLAENSQKSLFIGSVFEQEEGRDAIKVQLVEKQSLEKTPNRVFVLDFDYFLVNLVVEFDRIDEWIKKAHTNLESVFEGVVSDKTKALFDK